MMPCRESHPLNAMSNRQPPIFNAFIAESLPASFHPPLHIPLYIHLHPFSVLHPALATLLSPKNPTSLLLPNTYPFFCESMANQLTQIINAHLTGDQIVRDLLQWGQG